MIKAEGINKSYGGIKALNNISFQVDKGEIFGFIGPDGAGKSTLFRILTTLLLPDTGSISINNFDVVSDFKKVRRITGYMPGRFSLYQDLSVEENLNFFATVFGSTIEANYLLIKDVYQQIEPFKKRLAGRLSGGMKQKLALSCALIHQPEVLVLDEPTTGVDAVSRSEFWDLLQGLKNKGISILVSTPYMDEASRCDKVALIQNGNILAQDTPEKIIKSFSKVLYAIRSQSIQTLIHHLRGYESAGTVFPFGQELHYTDKTQSADIDAITKYLENKGHENISIAPIKPNIEDVFMELMGEGLY